MDTGNTGAFLLMLAGSGSPGLFYYLAKNLTTGQSYRFKVRSLNFNGESADSTELLVYSCLPPQNL